MAFENRYFTMFIVGLSAQIVFLFQTSLAFAQVAVITAVEGEVKVSGARGGGERIGRVGEAVTKGDTLVTSETSRVQIIFSNKNLLEIAPASEIRITEYEFDRPANGDHSVLDVQKGSIRFLTEQDYSAERRSAILRAAGAGLSVMPASSAGGDIFLKTEEANSGGSAKKAEVVSLKGLLQVGDALEKRKINEIEKIQEGQSLKTLSEQERLDDPELRDRKVSRPIDLDSEQLEKIQKAVVRPAQQEPFNRYKENHPHFAERFKPRAYIHMKNRMDAQKRKKKPRF